MIVWILSGFIVTETFWTTELNRFESTAYNNAETCLMHKERTETKHRGKNKTILLECTKSEVSKK